ncbi:SDR family oxidoreductase [Fructobacillus americanaquae]|uniref:SDR family oxidoreductase n=1 Tax=Fructobacillus americanaquae TaxID=2940302 RepID=A0ABY5BZ24_9LACO|nr:SDR family oxidoreductase [Fructobacillus americanaquae]USS91762.1 SDR family oxidoreductase [Fructobacillus americanaquae]
MLLENQVALVTGASRGIGAAVAKKFAAEGALVIVNFLKNQEKADAVVQEIQTAGGQAVAMAANVCDDQAVQDMMTMIADNFAGLDIVVNNALRHYSFNPKNRHQVESMPWSDYQEQFEGAVKAAYNVNRAALPLLKANQDGRIIQMISNLVQQPMVPYHDYITAKAALLGYSRALAKDLGPFGIRVNTIAPGLTYPTDSSSATGNDVRERLLALSATKWLTIPEDVAGTALYLASRLSNNVTGQCITVDGGLTMN